MNPFPTRQHAEAYLNKITDPAKREATRLKLLDYGYDFSESSPAAQAVPVQEKQASGLGTLPPPRKVVHREPAQPLPQRQQLGVLTFTLPYPPSLNSIWRAVVITGKHGKPQARVLLSQEGRAYRRNVINIIRSLGNPRTPPGARLALHLNACIPDRRARDLSNLPKALEDALTHAQVWADDSLIDDIQVTRGPVVQGGLISVMITPLTTTLFEDQL